jgi:GTPase
MSDDKAQAQGETLPEAQGEPLGETRCGFIAVIGAPNAGKSTLVNSLVGTKVAIVSRKVQTTRTTLRGIALEGQSQLVFIDTPGIFAPRRRLDRAMVEAAWGGAGDADLVLLVVDAAKGLDEDLERILTKLVPGSKSGRGRGEAGGEHSRTVSDRSRNLLLALNKVDRVRKEHLLELAAQLNRRVPFAETFMISALDGDGVADLKAHLAAAVPLGPWHYPPDEVTDAPMRVLAAEITREKVYDRLHDELPYQIAVETTAWSEQGKGVRVEQTIFVERDSQKAIVVGKGAAMIKQLSMESRRELSALLDRPVHLFLYVKVRENWGDDPARYRELGLTFPKE